MPYTVTRQCYWPDGTCVVELARGDINQAGPDMLSPLYDGEGVTYDSPVQAVEMALSIAHDWRLEFHSGIMLAWGSTLGGSLLLEPGTDEEAVAWAEAEEEKLPKCDHCQELLPEHPFVNYDLDDQKFCREYCAEQAWLDWSRSEPSQVCDDCLNVAHDHGAEGRRAQEETMMLLGADLEDHVCTAKEEPDLQIECHCACNRR